MLDQPNLLRLVSFDPEGLSHLGITLDLPSYSLVGGGAGESGPFYGMTRHNTSGLELFGSSLAQKMV